MAAVRLLGTRKDVNRDQIGLFGISQGGWIAPLAASRSDAAKFLILNVGPSVTVEEQELHRVEYTLRADAVPENDIADALEYTRLMFKVAYSGNGWDQLEQLGLKLKDKAWASTLSIPENQESLAGWKRIRFDPAPILRRTTVPVLSIFGENDLLVPPKENAAKMERYLKEDGNRDFTVRIIPNAGHDMESFGTLKGGEWNGRRIIGCGRKNRRCSMTRSRSGYQKEKCQTKAVVDSEFPCTINRSYHVRRRT